MAAPEGTRDGSSPIKHLSVDDLHKIASFLPKSEREELDDSFKIIAHELRNPLTALQMLTALLEREGVSPGIVSQIRSQLIYMGGLVNNLADVRKSPNEIVLNREKFDITALALETIETLPNWTGSHPLISQVPDNPVIGYWDKIRIKEVVLNLAENAVKYSDPGQNIDLLIDAKKSEVLVALRDYGLGIDAEELPHIFDLFSRGKNVGVVVIGAGIGLHVAKTVVEAHGGTIKAESGGLYKGSTFSFTLPYSLPS